MSIKNATIGRIKKVPLREIWKHEAHDFTPWLAENIDYLNDSSKITYAIVGELKIE